MRWVGSVLGRRRELRGDGGGVEPDVSQLMRPLVNWKTCSIRKLIWRPLPGTPSMEPMTADHPAFHRDVVTQRRLDHPDERVDRPRLRADSRRCPRGTATPSSTRYCFTARQSTVAVQRRQQGGILVLPGGAVVGIHFSGGDKDEAAGAVAQCRHCPPNVTGLAREIDDDVPFLHRSATPFRYGTTLQPPCGRTGCPGATIHPVRWVSAIAGSELSSGSRR